MSDLDTKERLARLKMAFPTADALGEWLGMSASAILRTLDGEDDYVPSTDNRHKIRKAHKQIQKEHAAGLDAVSYALQTIERLKTGTITDEQLDNVQDVLQEKADDLNTAYA